MHVPLGELELMADTPIIVGGQYRLGPTPSDDWIEVTAISPSGAYVTYKGIDNHKITEYVTPMWKFKSIIDAFREGEV